LLPRKVAKLIWLSPTTVTARYSLVILGHVCPILTPFPASFRAWLPDGCRSTTSWPPLVPSTVWASGSLALASSTKSSWRTTRSLACC
jgi:hypothetical protein